jgi:hypothetical protein
MSKFHIPLPRSKLGYSSSNLHPVLFKTRTTEKGLVSGLRGFSARFTADARIGASYSATVLTFASQSLAGPVMAAAYDRPKTFEQLIDQIDRIRENLLTAPRVMEKMEAIKPETLDLW